LLPVTGVYTPLTVLICMGSIHFWPLFTTQVSVSGRSWGLHGYLYVYFCEIGSLNCDSLTPQSRVLLEKLIITCWSRFRLWFWHTSDTRINIWICMWMSYITEHELWQLLVYFVLPIILSPFVTHSLFVATKRHFAALLPVTAASFIMGCYKHGNEPWISYKTKNFLTSWETTSFSRRAVLHGISLVCDTCMALLVLHTWHWF
jgi:hypothetical protein